MQLKIDTAKNLAIQTLTKNGFSQQEAEYITENCLEGELTNKKAHGFMRIPILISMVQKGRIKVGGKDIFIAKETPVSLLINGKGKTGLYVINKALELALNKVKDSGMMIVGTTNTAPMSGLIGQYARKATDKDLIFIGMNNSPARTSGIVPHGSIKRILGTNPLTIGIPTNELPVILDMASSKLTVGDVLVAEKNEKSLPEGCILNPKGKPSINPKDALDESLLGGILPIAEHKGSGLAVIIEMLAGALTNSRVGHNVEGGWGSIFILIDPNILRPLNEFKKDVDSLINEIKSSPKMKTVSEIYLPGEKSQKIRSDYVKAGEFELDDKIYEELNNLC